MIKATLEWRRSYQPDKIRPDDIAEEAVTGKVYPNGHDRHGRPILILCPGRENTRNPQKQCKSAGAQAIAKRGTRYPSAMPMVCHWHGPGL